MPVRYKRVVNENTFEIKIIIIFSDLTINPYYICLKTSFSMRQNLSKSTNYKKALKKIVA